MQRLPLHSEKNVLGQPTRRSRAFSIAGATIVLCSFTLLTLALLFYPQDYKRYAFTDPPRPLLSALSNNDGPAAAILAPSTSGVDYIQREPCGLHAAEAIARGCHFDMVEMAWVPDECYDSELEAELRAKKEWQFWRHTNKTGLITWDEAKSGEFDALLADWDFHIHHCVFRLHKFFRAVRDKGMTALSSNMAGRPHMLHCRDRVLDRDTPLDAIKHAFEPGFPHCGVRRW